MDKNELKNGMSFKMRNTYKFLILNGGIYLETIDGYEYSNKLNHFLLSYNNDMTDLDDDKYDIMKVYDIEGKLIWERDEVDWSKVKFGTKVIAWNDLHEDFKVEGLFLSLTPTAREPRFLVYYETKNCDGKPIGHAWTFDKCELTEEPKGEVALHELIEELLDKLNKLEKLVCINICIDRPHCMNYNHCNQCGTYKYVKEVMSEFYDLKLIIEKMEMDNN